MLIANVRPLMACDAFFIQKKGVGSRIERPTWKPYWCNEVTQSLKNVSCLKCPEERHLQEGKIQRLSYSPFRGRFAGSDEIIEDSKTDELRMELVSILDLAPVVLVMESVAGAYNKDTPSSQSSAEAITVEAPFQYEWQYCAADTRPSPEYSVCEPLTLNEPLIEVEDERVILQGASNAVEHSLREYKV